MNSIVRTLLVLASFVCPRCGWHAHEGHVCHPADR